MNTTQDGLDYANIHSTNETVKLIIIGDCNVGKSSILTQFSTYNNSDRKIYDKFDPEYNTTIGIDFKANTAIINGKKIKIQIWDTAGQERFRSIVNSYFKSIHGVIFVFDLTCIETMNNIEYWLTLANDKCDPDIPKILVGNKCDIGERIITTDTAANFAKTHGLYYIEVSAKNNINIWEAVLHLSTEIITRRNQNISETTLLTSSASKNVILDKHSYSSNCCWKY